MNKEVNIKLELQDSGDVTLWINDTFIYTYPDCISSLEYLSSEHCINRSIFKKFQETSHKLYSKYLEGVENE